MQKTLKKLRRLLPISRHQYEKDFAAINLVIDGLIEADANHSQIEMNLIKEIHKSESAEPAKAASKKGNNIGSMYG